MSGKYPNEGLLLDHPDARYIGHWDGAENYIACDFYVSCCTRDNEQRVHQVYCDARLSSFRVGYLQVHAESGTNSPLTAAALSYYQEFVADVDDHSVSPNARQQSAGG